MSPRDSLGLVRATEVEPRPDNSPREAAFPEALGRLLSNMEGRFGDIRIAPLYAREGMAASRVIVQGVKGAKGPMQLLPGLVLHSAGSQFTPEAEAILRDGLAWRLR